jgi:type I restriction enzyme S subunit
MSRQYPLVSLGKLLSKSNEWIDIIPNEQYRQITVKLWGQGVILRNIVSGTGIAAPRRFVARANQFILSRIDARNGALGLVPSSLDGAVVSNDFPIFNVDRDSILPEYLGWISKTHDFVELCKAASEGTTNRVRLQEDRFLALQIRLPTPEEQRRIVARIEEIEIKIKEAHHLRQETLDDADVLPRSILFSAQHVVPTPMHELVRLRELDVSVVPEETYHFAGVYSFGRGVFKGQRRGGTEFAYNKLTRLHRDNFVYPKLMAWEGALGIVPPECDGLVVSPEFPVFEVDQSRVFPEVLDVYFRTPSVWPGLSGASTGTNVRRRRLNPSDFLSLQFPLPSPDVQKQIHETRIKLDALKRLQAETRIELDTMLPAVLDRAFKGEL